MRIFGLFVALTLGACGGQVEKQPEQQQAQTADAGDDPWAGAPLGECKLGWKPGNNEEPCLWRSSGHCYATKHDACNCACPKDHDSICFSDYPDEGSPVEVSCF